ncbi:MAG: hypothetical protein H0U51_10485 [Propionibacteriales bacterium]|nr:hypothetical protein [Propionibacteriales bacterium]
MRRLAARFAVVEVAYDPWRWQGEALRLEAEGIGPMVTFPQSHARMRHPATPTGTSPTPSRRLTGRRWRLEQAGADQNVDAVVALAMAVERVANVPHVANVPQPVRLLGWV